MKIYFLPLYTVIVAMITIFVTAAIFSLSGHGTLSPVELLAPLWLLGLSLVFIIPLTLAFWGGEV